MTDNIKVDYILTTLFEYFTSTHFHGTLILTVNCETKTIQEIYNVVTLSFEFKDSKD